MQISCHDLISVVIPTRNRCARLLKAVESVRQQQGAKFEIVVVDDASTDGTRAAIEELAKSELRLRYVRNNRALGGGGARNAGVAVAQGEYIAFLDDDDQWFPTKLQKQLESLQMRPEVLAASCSFVIGLANGRDLVKRLRAPGDRQELLRANLLGGASVCMVRKSVFEHIGGFDPKLRSGQDWDLWLKLDALGPVHVCDDVLVRYIVHQDGSITGNPRGEYFGRRRIHLRYRLEMEASTRRYSLCELCFYRLVVFQGSWTNRLKGLIGLVLAARGADRLRFTWRTLKYFRQGRFSRAAT